MFTFYKNRHNIVVTHSRWYPGPDITSEACLSVSETQRRVSVVTSMDKRRRKRRAEDVGDGDTQRVSATDINDDNDR